MRAAEKDQPDPINDPIKLTDRKESLLRFLQEEPELTRKELAENSAVPTVP